MIEWLPAVASYWTLAALYLGGAQINIEGGGGRQVAGLAVHFVVFLVVFAIGRTVFQAMLGTAFGVALGLVTAAIFLPITAKLVFRIVGVRISSVRARGGEASA